MAYLVERLRYGILDSSTMEPFIGAAILLAMGTTSTAAATFILRTGYKLTQ